MTTGEAAGETVMRPLAGVRVVELGIWVAAPAAAAMLADWGADIVKVEPPGGDPNRRTLRHVGHDADAEPPFELDNRGKRSVVRPCRPSPKWPPIRRQRPSAPSPISPGWRAARRSGPWPPRCGSGMRLTRNPAQHPNWVNIPARSCASWAWNAHRR